MNWLALGAALTAGLFGSLHCLAMCGGIAVTLGAQGAGPGWVAAFRSALSLNGGRVLGYTLAGAAVGAIGASVLRLADWTPLANTLRLAVGAVMVLVALRLADVHGRLGWLSAPGQWVWSLLSRLQAILKHLPAPVRLPVSGVLWAFLPCGLSSTLLLAAWFEADPLRGAALMFAFGLGTLPAMVVLSATGQRSHAWLAAPVTRRFGALVIGLAGLVTLGAPWLSRLHPALPEVLGAMGCATAW